MALLLVACASAPPAPPCDEATLARIVAECTARVDEECASKGVIESDCAVLKECDKRLDERAARCR